MNILTAYYYISAHYLKEYLPCIPELKLTDAKTYYGKIYIRDNEYKTIALSKWNLDCGPAKWWDNEDFEELIDTICHEFAHMYYWEHGENHAKIKEAFKVIVKSELNYRHL